MKLDSLAKTGGDSCNHTDLRSKKPDITGKGEEKGCQMKQREARVDGKVHSTHLEPFYFYCKVHRSPWGLLKTDEGMALPLRNSSPGITGLLEKKDKEEHSLLGVGALASLDS